MKPEALLKLTTNYLKKLNEASTMYVAVGLPLEKVGGEVYEDSDVTILDVGESHEYGIGVPVRSFLRMPFDVEKKTISTEIEKQFEKVFFGNSNVKRALGRVGMSARNVVLKAFRTGGFGQWKDISQETKNAKKSSKILINTGTLRGAITWVVR